MKKILSLLAALCLAGSLFAVKEKPIAVGFEKDKLLFTVSKTRKDTVVKVPVVCIGKNLLKTDFSNLIITSGSKAKLVSTKPAISHITGSDTMWLTYEVKISMDTAEQHELFVLTLGLTKRQDNIELKTISSVITVTKVTPGQKKSKPSGVSFAKEVILVIVEEGIKDTVVPVQIIVNGDNPDLNVANLKPVSGNTAAVVQTSPVTKSSAGRDTITYQVKIHLDDSIKKDASFILTLGIPSKDKPFVQVGNADVIIYIVKKEKRSLVYPPTASFVTYTDFQGFRGDQPNGLVQFETNFSFCFRQKKFTRNQNLIWARNIVFGLNLTKLDDKLRYKQLNYYPDTTLSGIDTIRHIHTFDLIRYSNFNLYAKLNIATINFLESRMRVYWDFYGGLYSTGVRDTLLPAGKEFNLNSTGFGTSLKFATNYRSDESPINVSLGVTAFLIASHNNNVRQRIGPLYYPETDPRNEKYGVDGVFGGKTMTIFQFELRYSPSKDVSKNGKIFLRTNYYANIFNRISSDGTESDYGNNFLQVQLGYVGSFEELAGRFFPGKASDEPKEVQSGK